MPHSELFHTPLATVSWQWGTSGVLRGAIAGEIDATNRREVLDEVRGKLCRPRLRAAHLDAARLLFCDARSLVGLVEAERVARASGVQVEITNLAGHLLRLVELLALDLSAAGRREAVSPPDRGR